MRDLLDRFPAWIRRYNPFPPPENPQERLARLQSAAGDARLVLESPAHTLAYQKLLTRWADQILETRPEDHEARERLHMQAYVLQEMVREMAGAVHAYEAELARQNLVANQFQ